MESSYNMEKLTVIVKMVATSIRASLGFLVGNWSIFTIILLLLVIIDYVSGSIIKGKYI
ncbi:hypothetical protein [Bacillus sp. SM2101]|uniref:hypothetical protein n=1 Tax=Bacillus sp. SM2101 TaxID=2805366 RepID=UPI001BDE34E5|nr:hypothetical protein [Bacillus sp. SM2101]